MTIVEDYNAMILPTLQMVQAGLPFDGETVRLFRTYVDAERHIIEKQLIEALQFPWEMRKKGQWVMGMVNVRSNIQVMHYLYERCGLPVQRNPKTKCPSVDADALNILRLKFPGRGDLFLIAYLRHLLKARGDYLAMRVYENS